MQSRTRLILLVALLTLTALTAGVFLYSKNSRQSAPQTPPAKLVQTKELPAAEVPSGLPQNLPIEAGSQIIQNYEAVAKDGRVQGTRKFTTKKPLDAALQVYVDFFTKTAWTVASQQTDNSFVSAVLRRNQSVLSIVVKQDSALNKNVVEITLTEPQATTLDQAQSNTPPK